MMNAAAWIAAEHAGPRPMGLTIKGRLIFTNTRQLSVLSLRNLTRLKQKWYGHSLGGTNQQIRYASYKFSCSNEIGQERIARICVFVYISFFRPKCPRRLGSAIRIIDVPTAFVYTATRWALWRSLRIWRGKQLSLSTSQPSTTCCSRLSCGRLLRSRRLKYFTRKVLKGMLTTVTSNV